MGRNIEPCDTARVEVRHINLVAIFTVCVVWRKDQCWGRREPWRRLRENAKQLAFAAANIEDLA
jgi:hypothetical protein